MSWHDEVNDWIWSQRRGTRVDAGKSAVKKPRKKAFKLTPPDPSEDQFQHAIANLLDSILPADQVVWSHFPAGGYFLSPAARARLYRLGLKRGFPDIVICYAPARILWLEVKTPTGVISPAQRATHLLLRQLGHTVAVVRRIEQVIAVLMEYQVPFRRARLDGEWYARTQGDQGTAQSGAQEHPESNAERRISDSSASSLQVMARGGA